MCENPQGLPRDHAEAAKWYRLAAERGDAVVQHNLGVSYRDSLGVPWDYAQAHIWFNLAASRSPPDADRDLTVQVRDLVAERVTPAQIAEAEKLAREGRPK